MLLKLFYDQSKNVVEAVRTIFIPIFAEWSDLQGIFFKNFVPLFVTEITKLLKVRFILKSLPNLIFFI